MSVLDNRVKEFLPPVLRGQDTVIDRNQQAALAGWLAKMAIVGDGDTHFHNKIPHTPKATREYLMRNGMPPDQWRVLISSYGGKNWRDLFVWQHGGNLQLPSTDPTDSGGEEGYAQLTLVGMGKMLALIIATSYTDFDYELGDGFGILFERVWPLHENVQWPAVPVIQDGDIPRLEDIFPRMTFFPKPKIDLGGNDL
jgi:hypothetical protein